MQYYIFVFYWIFYISDKTEYYITLIPQTAITGFYIVLRSISWFYMKPKIWKLETKPKWKRDIELFYIDLYLFFNNSYILFWHFTQKVCWFTLKYYWLTWLCIRSLWWKSYHSLLEICSFYSQNLTDWSLTEFTLWYHIIKSHCTRIPPS